jgi:mannose-1-phosphate guanylyltransferase
MARCNAAKHKMTENLWSVVLAAGQGRRLSPVTRGIPKQFWSAEGGCSLLDETRERLAPLVPPERTTVVVGQEHQRYLPSARCPWTTERLVYQPRDRGTATGALLALLPVLVRAPDAIVLMTPSDHGIAAPATFHATVREVVADVMSRRLDVVLFGAEPTSAATDYGWITPGAVCPWRHDRRLRRVAGFAEKPAADVARRLLTRGAVWNTMVVVARLSVLLGLYLRHLPHLAAALVPCASVSGTSCSRVLSEAYVRLSSADFCRDLLASADDLAVYSWPASIGWSDLGTPEQSQAWLAADARSHVA